MLTLRITNKTYMARSLAGGYLTAKFANGEHKGTRFDSENPMGGLVQKVFGAEDLRAATKKFDGGVSGLGLTPIEVAIRWMNFHSALGDGDGIIIGASKVEQLKDTVKMIEKGPLNKNVLELAEELWDAVKHSRAEIM